jgi:5-methylcytosine-specific restriction protein B
MADPICRWRNSSIKQVVEFNILLPLSPCTKKEARAVVEHRWAVFGGKDFFQTPYQLAAQMGLYYEDDQFFYPRFDKLISIEEATDYMEYWGKHYYAPNPYTRSMTTTKEPIIINRFLVNWALDHKNPLFSEALKSMFSEDIGNTDILVNMINNFTDVTINNDIISIKPNAPHNRFNVVSPEFGINDKKGFFEFVGKNAGSSISLTNAPLLPLQQIFYGAPGTGKSHTVDKDYVKDNKCFRITFHPDTDYASFVGCYKPKMGGPTGEDITYSFVPQVFLNAYIYAWNHPDEPTYLVIEELNRGNCAQIFGDIFQLLDRQKTGHPGYSKYTINADSDIATYLSGELKDKESYEKVIREIYGPKEFDFSILALPSNLNILATMNTSDQSLFPIDSAFKRRWGMEYVGVNYTDAEQFTVVIDETHKYSWSEILKGLNGYIKQEKHSTNKILGNRFVQSDENNVISAVAFRDKVLFFLFNDVFKEEDEFRTDFFGGNDELYFEDLCEGDGWTTYVINFIEKTCGASNKSNTQQPDGVTPQQSEKESTTETE